ncbi:hypothetical protein ACJX0J_000832 [Zea mays]
MFSRTCLRKKKLCADFERRCESHILAHWQAGCTDITEAVEKTETKLAVNVLLILVSTCQAKQEYHANECVFLQRLASTDTKHHGYLQGTRTLVCCSEDILHIHLSFYL